MVSSVTSGSPPAASSAAPKHSQHSRSAGVARRILFQTPGRVSQKLADLQMGMPRDLLVATKPPLPSTPVDKQRISAAEYRLSKSIEEMQSCERHTIEDYNYLVDWSQDRKNFARLALYVAKIEDDSILDSLAEILECMEAISQVKGEKLLQERIWHKITTNTHFNLAFRGVTMNTVSREVEKHATRSDFARLVLQCAGGNEDVVKHLDDYFIAMDAVIRIYNGRENLTARRLKLYYHALAELMAKYYPIESIMQFPSLDHGKIASSFQWLNRIQMLLRDQADCRRRILGAPDLKLEELYTAAEGELSRIGKNEETPQRLLERARTTITRVGKLFFDRGVQVKDDYRSEFGSYLQPLIDFRIEFPTGSKDVVVLRKRLENARFECSDGINWTYPFFDPPIEVTIESEGPPRALGVDPRTHATTVAIGRVYAEWEKLFTP